MPLQGPLRFFAFLFSCTLALCATALGSSDAPLWSLKLNKLNGKMAGFITDMAISDNGTRILAAVVPDKEDPQSTKGPYLLYLEAKTGKILWYFPLDAQIRTLALSNNGNFAVFSAHNDTLVALNGKGDELWSIEATCHPILLNQTNKILCYHDEDAAPRIAFDLYDWKSKLHSSFPISTDILALKVSDDERNTVMGLTGGHVVLAGPNFKARWKKVLVGEVVDLAVSNGKKPRTAVILNPPPPKTPAPHDKNLQKLVLLNPKGKILAQADLGARMRQLEFSPDGTGLVAYGNTDHGQYISYYQLKGGRIEERWQHSEEKHAEFSSYLTVGRKDVAACLDPLEIGNADSKASSPHHFLVFDPFGNRRWDISVPANNGAAIATYAYSEQTRTAAIALDDGTLIAYQLGK